MKTNRFKKLDIQEVFSSIQGEGIFVGKRQIFIRFSRCNLQPKCSYCDTKIKPLNNTFPLNPAKNKTEIQNSTNQLIQLIEKLEKIYGPHHCVSLTGGEPLLYVDYLALLIPQIKKTGLKIYLETNGTCYKQFKKIKNKIDILAMDIKLPADCRKNYWQEHKKFLTLANNKKTFIFIKIVLTAKTNRKEIKTAIKLIADVNRNIPLIFQPVTPLKKIFPPKSNTILAYQSLAGKYLKEVRVIPQVHKILGLK
ncbi:7-carboxy-7-deazaguanine synthase QueE [bacterium]|nr:7-carboxy-7-deazaguanine synthase QueE [bacterium]